MIQAFYYNDDLRRSLMYKEYLNPRKLDSLFIYIEALNSLIEEYNDYVNNPISLIEDTDKIGYARYKIQRILGDIFLLIPYKINIRMKEKVKFISLKENIFEKNISSKYITDQLIKIILKHEYNEFFFMNYFLRNSTLHSLHNTESNSHLGSEKGIYHYKFELVFIDGKSNKQKDSFMYLKSLSDLNNGYPLSDCNSIHLTIINEKQMKLSFTVRLKMIHEIIKQIRDAFLIGLQNFNEDIEKSSAEKIQSTFNITKDKYQTVINIWINSIISLQEYKY